MIITKSAGSVGRGVLKQHLQQVPLKKYPDLQIFRDNNLEKDAIQCSGVELIIRNDMHSANLRRRMQISFDSQGSPILCNGSIKILPNQPSSFFTGLSFNPFWPQPECEPTIYQYDQPTKYSIYNRDSSIDAKFIMLRICQPDANISYCVGSEFWSDKDKEFGRYLGKEWDVSGEWNSREDSIDGPWSRVPIQQPGANIFRALDFADTPSYYLEYYPNGRSYSILPLQFYQHHSYKSPLKLFVPPRPPYTLVNSQYVGRFPKAKVYLTDDFFLALLNAQCPEYVFLWNPGGNAWVENLDISKLHGRRVTCPVVQIHTENHNIAQSYQSALNMANRLEASGIKTEFSEIKFPRSHDIGFQLPVGPCLESIRTKSGDEKIISKSEFIKHAQAHGAHVPDLLRLDRFGCLDVQKLEKTIPLIENCVDSGEVTIIVEHSRIDQNMVSSLLFSILIGSGRNTLPFWRKVSDSQLSCLVFLDFDRAKHFMTHFRRYSLAEVECLKNSIHSTKIFMYPEKDGYSEFKKLVGIKLPKVVIFDAESLRHGNAQRIQLLRNVMHYCASENIAVVIVVRSQQLLQLIPCPDRQIEVWSDNSGDSALLVEEKGNHQGFDPFKISFNNKDLVMEPLDEDVLANLPERQRWSTYKPGVDPDVLEELNSMS